MRHGHPKTSAPLLAVLIVCAAANTLWAQPSVGVKGGANLIGWYQVPNAGPGGTGTNESSAGVVGPYVRMPLLLGLSAQVEGLRRGYGFTRTSGRAGLGSTYREDGSAWEFPVLLLVRSPIGLGGWTPFVNAGPAVRYVTAGWRNSEQQSTPFQIAITETSGRRRQASFGTALGGGLERRLGLLVGSVEFRWTRWQAIQRFPDLPANQNQAALLFGIRTGIGR